MVRASRLTVAVYHPDAERYHIVVAYYAAMVPVKHPHRHFGRAIALFSAERNVRIPVGPECARVHFAKTYFRHLLPHCRANDVISTWTNHGVILLRRQSGQSPRQRCGDWC